MSPWAHSFVELVPELVVRLVQRSALQTVACKSAAVEQSRLAEAAEQQTMVAVAIRNGAEQPVHWKVVLAVTMDGAVVVDALTVSFHRQE